MEPLAICFWMCAALVGYTYLGYPLLLWLACRWGGRPHRIAPTPNSLSIVVAVHNEEGNLARRLNELILLLRQSGQSGEIVVVSDGSTDGTAEIARGFAPHGVRLLELAEKQGKAVALSTGCAAALGDILLFADVRQRWAEDALERLSENFADPRVGAVSGALMLEAASGTLAGVGLYWRFEKWLRVTEGRLFAQVGVTGAISACRRSLFKPVPPGTILDDVYWPMRVVLQGYRVVHDERAQAFDRLPDSPRDEFRRKVRTLAGNFQLLGRLPATVFLPWKNRVWWQWLSHKLLRLVVPWALLGLLFCSVLLPGSFYRAALLAQVGAYACALLGLVPAVGRRFRLLGTAASFLMLNGAAWLSFWVWITGRAGQSWQKVQYQQAVGAAERKMEGATAPHASAGRI
jgi:poly-beta-1,6-N-acetyl-D-glucosamine synthase